MAVAVRFPTPLFDRVWDHLLLSDTEEAAFLMADYRLNDQGGIFVVSDLYLIGPDDFTFQSSFHLSLADETRVAVIKWAWQLGGSLIEVHAHRGPQQAMFSHSDMYGCRCPAIMSA